MEDERILNDEENEILEGNEMVISKNTISSFTNRERKSNTICNTITNITDMKQLYNLSMNADCKLNDCVGEKIRIKGVVIKFYDKKLDEPKINAETGEVQEFERKISCVIVDEAGKSYATGSKTFAYQLMNFIDGGYITETELTNSGLDVEIIKRNVQNSPNKALGFKVL